MKTVLALILLCLATTAAHGGPMNMTQEQIGPIVIVFWLVYLWLVFRFYRRASAWDATQAVGKLLSVVLFANAVVYLVFS